MWLMYDSKGSDLRSLHWAFGAVTSPISYYFVRSPSFHDQKLLEQWLTIIDKGSASNAPLPSPIFSQFLRILGENWSK